MQLDAFYTKILQQQLALDSTLLRELDIMDYSLLLGIGVKEDNNNTGGHSGNSGNSGNSGSNSDHHNREGGEVKQPQVAEDQCAQLDEQGLPLSSTFWTSHYGRCQTYALMQILLYSSSFGFLLVL